MLLSCTICLFCASRNTGTWRLPWLVVDRTWLASDGSFLLIYTNKCKRTLFSPCRQFSVWMCVQRALRIWLLKVHYWVGVVRVMNGTLRLQENGIQWLICFDYHSTYTSKQTSQWFPQNVYSWCNVLGKVLQDASRVVTLLKGFMIAGLHPQGRNQTSFYLPWMTGQAQFPCMQYTYVM